MTRATLILVLTAAALARPAAADTCAGRVAITQVEDRLMAKTGPNAGALEYTVTVSNLTAREQSYRVQLIGFERLSSRPTGAELRAIAPGASNSERLGIAKGFAVNLAALRAAIRLSCATAGAAPGG